MEPFARIPLRYDNEVPDWAQVEAAVARRRRSTRRANLGIFTGYRVGLDLGNGNIGWCILFEQGPRLRFLTAEDIAAHNAALPPAARRMQFPDLANFVPLGTHKFQPRERGEKVEKSHSKIRAESGAKRGLLDARQRRKLYLRRALIEAGLLPREDEALAGHVGVKADKLRVKLLDPSFAAHPHDLGRALYNTLRRRGYMKPLGRAGKDEGSSFGKNIAQLYRETLERFSCETVGQFLERCAQDARRDGLRFRKRHRSLAWQHEHRKSDPKDKESAKSHELFQFLTPTFDLIWAEAELLRKRQNSNAPISDTDWARIKETAEFRRGLKAKTPGPCRWLPGELRCVRALPSFQRFRILEQVSNLRSGDGRRLELEFGTAAHLLEGRDKITLAELARELGTGSLKLDKGDDEGKRSLVGAKTDVALAELLGEAWSGLPIERKDHWTMRFLRRHWPQGGSVAAWTQQHEETLSRDAESAFGAGALAKIDDEGLKELDDKFANISLKAAQVLAAAYERRADHEERMSALLAAGARQPELALYERLPYYAEAMPDVAVPAIGFAPAERTSPEELAHGRAANPDVHVVMNRLRAVVNEIVEMMGGILPSRCVIEVARSALSEDAANEHTKRARERERLREMIIRNIDKVFEGLGRRRPIGPGLDRLVDRWKAAIRQGWRDYDGSVIPCSHLIDASIYQLDHVSPAAFGDFRENNLFVSKYNQAKGRRLPWQAFGDDPNFAPALAAFVTFGLEQRRTLLNAALGRWMSARKREGIEQALKRAGDQLAALSSYKPRPDVLGALRRTLTDRLESLAADGESGDESGAERGRGAPRAFKPGDQAALFCRFHPDRQPPEGGFAARDTADIGWTTKLALRYLRRLGAETVAIKSWATHALRSMFDINKCRDDLRNHAVDAFLVAHFDNRVLLQGFTRLRANHFEDLYDPRALGAALEGIRDGTGFIEGFEDNLCRLEDVLPAIATAHRPDNQWNPGDPAAGSFGAFGGENIYTFRPTKAERAQLTAIVREAGKVPPDGPIMTRGALLALLVGNPSEKEDQELQRRLAKAAWLRYRTRQETKSKETRAKVEGAKPLASQPGAFINAEGKFAIIGPSPDDERRIISVADLSRMGASERAALFAGNRPIYRGGDTVVVEGKACVITAMEADGRLDVYGVDDALRKRELLLRPTVPARYRQGALIQKLQSDVLGRRLHRLRKDPGGLEPVPYPLRG